MYSQQRHAAYHGGTLDRPPSAPPSHAAPPSNSMIPAHGHAPAHPAAYIPPKPNHFPQPSANGTEPRPTLPPCTPPTLVPEWRFTKAEIDRRYSMHIQDREKVRNLSFKGINFLFSLATRLLVSQATLATAATLFHRFFMSQSFDYVHQYDIATVAMYHAAKAEERVLKIDHVAEMAFWAAQKDPNVQPAFAADECKKWKARIRELEPWFTASIGFDFYIEHPYRPLNNFLLTTKVPVAVGRLAMVLINDSFRTTLCLQHPPAVIAAAALRIASKLHDPLPGGSGLRPDWMQVMGVDRLAVLDAATQMLALHEARWAPPAPAPAPAPATAGPTATAAPGRRGASSASSASAATTPGSTCSGGVRTPNNVGGAGGGGTPQGFAGSAAGPPRLGGGDHWHHRPSSGVLQSAGQESVGPGAAAASAWSASEGIRPAGQFGSGSAGPGSLQPWLGGSQGGAGGGGTSGGGSDVDMDLEEGEL